MQPPVLFLVLCLTGVNLFQGASGLTACATPGFYLSSDSNWCFAYSSVYKPAPFQSVVCKSYGAELLTIESAEKKALVSTFLTDAGRVSTNKVHFGLTNILGRSSDWAFYKISGALTYTNWNAGNPVSTNRYNCASFSAGSPDYNWSNGYCLTDLHGMCQRPATAVDTA